MDGVIFGKNCHTFVQLVVLMVLDKGSAGTQSFLMASGSYQRNGAYAVVHQFPCKFSATHTRIADGEVETVGNGITQIIVVYQMETVAQEDFLQAVSTFAVHFHFIKEVVLTFIGCFKHGGKSILRRVAGAGGECIEYAVDEYCAEGSASVALCQPGIDAVIQFV